MHPLPVSLPKECRKAEKIIKSFIEPSRNGLDGVRGLGLFIVRCRADAARGGVLVSSVVTDYSP